MATQVARIKEALAARQRALNIGQTIGYAGTDAPFEFYVNGQIYVIEPEGTLLIQDRYGIDTRKLEGAYETTKASARNIVLGRAKGTPKLIQGAFDVVAHALMKYESRGLYFLTGDPAEDEKAKSEAFARFMEWRKANAESILQGYWRRVAKITNDPRNVGQPAPPMNDRERAAQEFLDDMKLGNYGRKRFICPHNCGYDSDDQARVEKHVRAAHAMAEAKAPVQLTAASAISQAPAPSASAPTHPGAVAQRRGR